MQQHDISATASWIYRVDEREMKGAIGPRRRRARRSVALDQIFQNLFRPENRSQDHRSFLTIPMTAGHLTRCDRIARRKNVSRGSGPGGWNWSDQVNDNAHT